MASNTSDDDIVFIKEIDHKNDNSENKIGLKRKLNPTRAPLGELVNKTLKNSDSPCKKFKTNDVDVIALASKNVMPPKPVKYESAKLKNENQLGNLKQSSEANKHRIVLNASSPRKLIKIKDENKPETDRMDIVLDEEVDEISKLSIQTYTDYEPKKRNFI